ncbi:hypothetical protein TNCT_27651 [Trichonephila clavata]|uniref:Uncharacterized protein n=1 Tax=Trichonephila clavata TaxID=2740835 RepID=A0A8X6GQE2_TRICU|nr:hypothetical protein TNCT_27651 [Trichonephila clavata]
MIDMHIDGFATENVISLLLDLSDAVARRTTSRSEGSQTQAVVTATLGTSQRVIFRLRNQFLDTRNIHRGSRQDHMPVTTQNEDQYLKLMV